MRAELQPYQHDIAELFHEQPHIKDMMQNIWNSWRHHYLYGRFPIEKARNSHNPQVVTLLTRLEILARAEHELDTFDKNKTTKLKKFLAHRKKTLKKD